VLLTPRKPRSSVRWRKGQIILIAAYDGEARDDIGEVYKVEWSDRHRDWRLHVRLFHAEGEQPRFRNFILSKVEAE
jgi:hypothetical protein